MITTYSRAVINAEIFDAFSGRSTTAQEVSKSTEVQYTTLQLREQQPAKSPAREAEYHRRIRRTIARKLLHRRTDPRVHTRVFARARAHMVRKPKNANYEFLRCNSNVVFPSRSPPRVIVFLLFLTFSLSLSRRLRCRTKKVGTSSQPTASEFRGYGRKFIKSFVRRLTTTSPVFRARELLYTGPRVILFSISIAFLISPPFSRPIFEISRNKFDRYTDQYIDKIRNWSITFSCQMHERDARERESKSKRRSERRGGPSERTGEQPEARGTELQRKRGKESQKERQ